MSISVIELSYLNNLNAIAFEFNDKNLVVLDSPNTSHPDGRWSILAADPIETLELNSTDQDDLEIFKIKTQELTKRFTPTLFDSRYTHLPFTCGIIGIASYDLGITEPGINLKLSSKEKNPKAISHLFAWCYLWDHQEKMAYLLVHDEESRTPASELLEIYNKPTPVIDSEMTLSAFKKLWNFDKYKNSIGKTKQYIADGDVYQINLAQKYTAKFAGEPLQAYWSTKDWALASSSPERFIKIQNKTVETKPIKGTRPNSGDDNDIHNLKNSQKDMAENLMIVDLLRNDISKHCSHVSVSKLFDIETYPTVHHMVSTITGNLNKEASNLDLFWDAFPGGSITGAPKKRAMEIIDELEDRGRSFYCGSVFYQSTNGNFDSNILIRTFIFSDGKVETWAGGGIVADSTAEDEYQECEDKIQKLMDWLK